jgi:hypothetical protein
LIREAFRERTVTGKDVAKKKVKRGEISMGTVMGLSDSEKARVLEKYKRMQMQRRDE